MDDRRDASTRRGALAFGNFVLDLNRAELADVAGRVVPLRPKTLALLECLVAQAGCVAERGALLDAVWPGVTVTDESLSQAVAELRQALGEEGRRLIRTVPRRGYMLDARPHPVAAGAAPVRAPQQAPPLGMAMPAASGRKLASDAVAATTQRALQAVCLALATGGALALGAGTLWQHGTVAPTEQVARPPEVRAWIDGGDPPPFPPVVAAPRPSPREVAEEFYRDGVRWSRREGGVAAWLGQRDLFRQAIAADPGFAPAWAHLVFTYTNVIAAGRSLNPGADLRAAEQAAERAVALAPQASDAYAALGSVLRVQPDRIEEALAAYRRAVALSPDAHRSRANVGYALILLGRPEEAEPHLRASLAAAPLDHGLRGSWHHYLGLVGLHLGRGDYGASEFRLALCARCSDPENRALHLAAALAHLGQLAEARVLVGEARQRAPGLTVEALRAEAPSRHPAYRAQRERLLEGLALAGLPL